MCAPALIPVLAGAAGYGGAAAAGITGAQLAFATVAAAAAGASAGAEMQAAEKQENLAEQQQTVLNAEAENVRIEGSTQAAQALTEAEKIAARNRAKFAAGGISTQTGTALQVGEEVAQVGALEQLTILNNANRQAYGLEAEGQNIMEQAKARKSSAKTRAFTTVLTAPLAAYGGFGA